MIRKQLSVLITVLFGFTLVFGQEQEGTPFTAEPVLPEQGLAEGSLRTASYNLFAIDSSGVSGNLNVSERVDGGTYFVVTLVGIDQGQQYRPVIFRGDCGPDRERVVALPTVGSIQNDPFVSLANVSASFEQVTEGDYFMYIYDGESEEGEPIACGEVGVGANR